MAGRKPGTPKTGGRKKGTPNKRTVLLQDAIIEAATRAGDKAGLVGYLENQARTNATSFNTLFGRVIPLQVAGQAKDGAIQIFVSPTDAEL